MKNNNIVIGGIIADTSDKVLTGGIIGTKDRTLSGGINPGSVIIRSAKWGEITGDINNQTDLCNKITEKENTDSVKIISFFDENPDFQNRYLISISDQPINDVKDYIQLVVDGRVGNDSMWIPYELGKLCLIIAASSSVLDKAIRFYVPKKGLFGIVDLTDELDLVRIKYRSIDEIPPTEWSEIQGSIYDNPELAAALEAKLNKWDNITVQDVDSLFE